MRAGRIVLITFAAGLALSFAAWWMAGAIMAHDVFDAAGVPRNLDRMPAVAVRELKLAHARARSRYELGVFGNSRMVSLSTADLGATVGRYFNFSVPGTSIRNSVAMLERLARADRLPRTAVVGLDNLYLEYFENAESGLAERFTLVGGDLSQLFAGNVPLRASVKILWRHALKTWTSFETWLTFSSFAGRQGLTDRAQSATHESDGSRLQEIDTSKAIAFDVPARLPAVFPSVLDGDLRRLKTLSDEHDVRIFVLETPLHPHARTSGGRSKNLREAFLASCAKIGLECYALSGQDDALAASNWPDATHAPSGALGKVISGLLATGSSAR